MTITFVSNFLNIHQSPFCDCIIDAIGLENFHFVSTTKMDQNRVDIGFEDMNETKPYVIPAYKGGEYLELAKKVVNDSDIVIMGSAPYTFMEQRNKANRITFKYNERIFKNGIWRIIDPRIFKEVYRNFIKYRRKPFYVLCAGAYVKSDLALYGFPRSKCFKWGYFPEIGETVENDNLFERKREKNVQCVNILWAGRLIDWKHPEYPIRLASYLKERGYSFKIRMAGRGEMKEYVINTIAEKELSDCIEYLGPQSHESILELMRDSAIFLFTSDSNEGWGAVLNEAMTCGCAVVANKAIGSVPYMIENGVNGLVYKNGDSNAFLEKVETVVKDQSLCECLSRNAIETIRNEWNITIASKRLIDLIENLCSGKEAYYKSGPCSLA